MCPSSKCLPHYFGQNMFNESVPFEGATINFFNSLEDLADGDFSIAYTHGSKAANNLYPTSSYTAAIQDVEDGLVDLAVGPFWVTG